MDAQFSTMSGALPTPPMETSSSSAQYFGFADAANDAENKQKRARTSKPKVKTGCNNCKQRRIKCDEQRPSCNNCLRSKKICAGYPAPPRAARSSEVLRIAPKPLASSGGTILPIREPVFVPMSAHMLMPASAPASAPAAVTVAAPRVLGPAQPNKRMQKYHKRAAQAQVQLEQMPMRQLRLLAPSTLLWGFRWSHPFCTCRPSHYHSQRLKVFTFKCFGNKRQASCQASLTTFSGPGVCFRSVIMRRQSVTPW